MKLNLKQINYKQLFIQHVEKAALVIFVITMLTFVSGAFNRQVYDKTPDQLSAGAQRVQQHVRDSSWQKFEEAAKENIELPAPRMPAEPYPELVKKSQRALAVADFAYPTVWDPRILNPNRKRADPKRLPLEEIRVAYGYGPFAIRDPNAVGEGNPGLPDEGIPGKLGPKKPPAASKRPPADAGYPTAKTATGKGAAAFLKNLQQKKDGKVPTKNVQRPGGNEGPGARFADGPTNMQQPRNRPPMGPGFGMFGGNSLVGVVVNQGVKVEGRRWVAITGAVPYYQQQDEFFNALGTTTSNIREQDRVAYDHARIERAEVSSDSTDVENLDWRSLSMNSLASEIELWDETPLEPVDPSVIEPALCLPLPPLVGRAWDTDMVVHPRIPLLDDENLEKRAQEALSSDEAEAAAKKGGAGDEGVFRVHPSVAIANRGAYGPEMGGMRRLDPGASVVKEQQYHLFRFFDFSAEPGKSYRYRVQLVMKNPNFELPEKEVELAKLTKDEFTFTPWSEPSELISIPLDSHLLAGPAKAAMPSREASAMIMVRQWDHKHGVNAAKKFDVYRGQVVNFIAQEVKIKDPATEEADTKKIDFRTNQLLVDFTGGDRLRSRLKTAEPAEMLFIKADGTLVVQRELDDQTNYLEESSRLSELSEELTPAAENNDPFWQQPPGIDPLGEGRPNKTPKKANPRAGS